MNRFYSILLYIKVSILFVLSISQLNAQPKSLQFKHITPDEGLSSSSVTSMIQDNKDFLWIGTYDGLNRYDGYDLKVYKNISLDSTSLNNNLIWTVFEDRQGILLVGTSGGLSLYNNEQDNFYNYMDHESSPLFGLENAVKCITEDSLGNLWLASEMGLIYFNRMDNKIDHYVHDPENENSLSNTNVEYVLIDSKNNIWINTREGLNLFIEETKSFIRVENKSKNSINILNTFFLDNVEDELGYLWFGTYDGLFCIHIDEIESRKFIHYQNDPNDDRSISGNRVLSLFIDNENNLWAGTENSGLNLFDRKTGKFWRYRSEENNPNSLNNESIHSIYQDNTGNLLIGTFAGGINMVKKYSNAIIHYQSLSGNTTSLSNNSVTIFVQDHKGKIWLGTDGGGLNLFEIDKGIFTRYNSENTNLNSNSVLSIVETSDNEIWFGTWAGGLNKFNLASGSFKSFTTENSEISDNNIFHVMEDSKGILWLGSFQNGLIRFDKKKNIFKKYTLNEGLANNMVVVIKEDSEGRLHIGTPNGYSVFDPEEESFINYSHDPDDTTSISNNSIHDIVIENDTAIWFGTQNGLDLFNPVKNIFKHYYEKDGLPDNVIQSIAFDKNGMLWITTNRGVCRFDTKNEIYKNFTKSDGLQGNEFNPKSSLNTKDGIMLLGGRKGFNVIYPDRIIENKNIPHVIITDFRIFNKPVKIGEEGSPLQKHISETKELILSYKFSVFTFSYAAMDFTMPEKNQYAYIMENFEKEWNYVGNKREATYTNLNAGEYIFRVKASNNDGLWNKEGVSIKIKILPPWWKTWWFRISLGLFIIGSAISFYFYRINQIKRQKEELEHQVALRTHELKEANVELRTQKEEILAQNEEIQQQSEELAAQRDAVEAQNKEIQAKNKEISKAYDNIRIISEFGQRITATLRLEAINTMIYDYVSSLMDTSAFGIGVYSQNKEYIEYVGYMENGVKLPPFYNKINEKNSLSVWCLKNRKELLINDFDKEYKNYIDARMKYHTKKIPSSYMYVPLITENKPIGVITAQSYNKNAYTQKDLTTLQSLASYISIALDNAHVYEIINKQNQHIKSSIEYAKTIQNSILPIEKNVGKYFESLIIYKPKDIVSGDFYWFTTEKNKEGKELVFFAVVDCTGHGVPGAFMSLIGSRLLNEIVNQKQILNPAQILEFLNIGIQLSLKQDQTDNNDGMDICLCRFERIENEKYKLLFSGAKRPLYIYKNGNTQIQRIPGARKSIGGIRAKRSRLFYTNNETIISKGDIIYLTTDGFVDQNAP
ncbi:MAG: GAF domain-containing protein, partial [Bacteroidales bacterium]|nr:GAF domain-containing protein [Bacteroidales bacterium]